jgi:hypothetical protein
MSLEQCEKRRFAGTRWADQTGALAKLQAEVQVFKHGLAIREAKDLWCDDARRDQDRRPIVRASRQDASDQRQHGRVGEMEQHDAAGKDQERAIAKEMTNIGWRSLGGRLDYSAVGRVGVAA